MMRSILGVVVGYLATFLVVFVTCTAAYFAMGADRAFQPGTYDVSTLWLVVSFALGVVAAVIGGAVCRMIAPSMTAVYVLVAIVIVLGLAMAVGVMMADPAELGPRTGDVPNLEAMTKAQTPPVAAFLNPFIGAAGILVGGMMVDRRRKSAPGGFPVSQR